MKTGTIELPGGTAEWRTVHVRVRDADGAEGWGEAAPNRFYGETPESVVAALARFRDALADLDPWHLEEAEARMNAVIDSLRNCLKRLARRSRTACGLASFSGNSNEAAA